MTALTTPRLPAPTRHVATPAWRRQMHEQLRRAGWLGAVGLVLLPLMLWAFYQVMHASVTQAQVRHASAAAQAEAQWRCRLTSVRQPCDAASDARVERSGSKSAGFARISNKVN